jgi:cephalosporin hydroxylase
MSEYYKCIPSEEMTDFSEFYQRMANELPDDAIIAECGIANGRSGIMLAEMLSDLGKNFTLYLIDNFVYGGRHQRNDIIAHMVNSGMGNRIKLLEMSSLDASCEFPDNYFNLVFIDSSHKYQQTKAETRSWFYKVVHEGILSGHDYTSTENPEVAMAINEVVPRVFTRNPIDEQIFKPEPLLQMEQTDRGHGVWFLQKKWWIKLN